MKVTVLGSGTSQGVPVIACECEVCTSTDPKDYRRRCSILLEHKDTTVVIDTGPDFREQMLRAKVKHMDAVVFTHEHKDHVAGLDDIRAFNFKTGGKDMEVYATEQVQEALKREFSYVFAEHKYPGIPQISLNKIDSEVFQIGDLEFIPIDVWHYFLPVKAYRIGDFAYLTDASRIDTEEREKLKNLDVLIITALRKEKHISHFNLEEALEIISELKPRKAYLTHISHLMGRHAAVSAELPAGVEIAYDGLEIDL